MKARVNLYTATNGRGVRCSNGIFIVIVEFIPRSGTAPATKTIQETLGQVSLNQLELEAIVAGLECLNRPCEVTVYTNSGYVINTIGNKRLKKWHEDGWKNARKEPVKNGDLWQKLYRFMEMHDITLAADGKRHTYAEYMWWELERAGRSK